MLVALGVATMFAGSRVSLFAGHGASAKHARLGFAPKCDPINGFILVDAMLDAGSAARSAANGQPTVPT